jgi:hypothetical protein
MSAKLAEATSIQKRVAKTYWRQLLLLAISPFRFRRQIREDSI